VARPENFFHFSSFELPARLIKLFLIGRLKEGATAASAQTELNAVAVTWSARTGIAPGGGDAGHVFLPPGKDDGHNLQ
jgi:hypothetical protein